MSVSEKIFKFSNEESWCKVTIGKAKFHISTNISIQTNKLKNKPLKRGKVASLSITVTTIPYTWKKGRTV